MVDLSYLLFYRSLVSLFILLGFSQTSWAYMFVLCILKVHVKIMSGVSFSSYKNSTT